MGIRYAFTGEVIEDGGKVFGVFTKTATWGPFRRLLDKSGIYPAQRVRESEKDCVEMVEAIQHRNPIHGDAKDLEGYRLAWQSIRARKRQLGLPLDTEAI